MVTIPCTVVQKIVKKNNKGDEKMNKFEKFKKLENVLGTERVLKEIIYALSESEAEELADHIAKNFDICLEISEDNVVEIVEDILSSVIYMYNEKLVFTTDVPEDWELCDTIYEDEEISIEPLIDTELNEIKGYLVWLKEDEEYKKRFYLKVVEA